MKKIFAMAMLATMMVACTNESDELTSGLAETQHAAYAEEVTLTFTPYEQEAMTRGGAQGTPQAAPRRAATRAATSITDYCTRLDVWIADGDGTTVSETHQTSADSGFGTVTARLDKRQTYTLCAVAHKCSASATMDGGVVIFPDEKLTHSMVYTTTFTPAETTTLDCLMQRIVGQFRLATTDAVSDGCRRMQFQFTCNDRWRLATATSEHPADKTVTINLNSVEADGTTILNIFLMPSSMTSTDNIDITVTPQDADGQPLQQPRTFSSVPIRAGYRTTYRGMLFTESPLSATFTVEDWSAFDVVEF